MADNVRIEGLDKLLRKIKSIEGLAAARVALKAGALHIKGIVDRYPPETSANSPSNVNGRWYERGYGPRWRRKSGGIGGSKTSKTLGRRWTTTSRLSGLQQVVGNNVSYGPYVQDRDKQAGFHAARGWKTIQDVSEEESEVVLNLVRAEIEKALEG